LRRRDYAITSGIIGALILILDIWAIISVVFSGSTLSKKVGWVVLIFFVPVIGAGLWLISGPRAAASS